MKVDVILGLQWGDEGKGKIVDVLSPRYDIIARFQGGPNAGHTLEFNGHKMVLHTIPSGIFHETKINVIGNGVVLDPVVLADELKEVRNLYSDASKNLFIAKRAHLITPAHRLLDAALESAKGENKIGSTLKGIAPAYTDKYSRNGIRIGDLLRNDFTSLYDEAAQRHFATIQHLGFSENDFQIEGLSYQQFEQRWKEEVRNLISLNLIDSEIFLNEALRKGSSILAEGAQGTLLDVDFGSYPFVTSSSTSTGGVCTGLGIAPRHIGEVFGVFKAYCTRVGSGPFPTELEDETGELLRKKGFEFGATTGRPRRCGWLDLPALKYAIDINGVSKLIVTKADVLDDFDELALCTAYEMDGKKYFHPTYEIHRAKISPALVKMKGWKESVSEIKDFEALPVDLKAYLSYIEETVETKISMISTGPDRCQIIELK